MKTISTRFPRTRTKPRLGAKRTGVAVAVVGSLLATPGIRKRLVAAALRIPNATHRVHVERNVRIRTDDGIDLATDVYHPRGMASPGPTILIRTPYGRRGWSGALSVTLSTRFAERGYRVVMQDVRGRFDSDGGPFLPYLHEESDGVVTATWIRGQPWSDGQIGTWGPSYLGYVQWALAAAPGGEPAAMMPITTSADIGSPDASGVVALDTILRWILTVDAMENTSLPLFERISRILSPRKQERLLKAGFAHLPLSGAGQRVLDKPSAIWQLWVDHTDPNDSVWQSVNHARAAATTSAAIHSVTGWFDLFLDRQLADHAAVVAAGGEPYLTIGPWHHLDPRMQLAALKMGMDWFDTHLRGARGQLREHPIRVWVSGVNEWRDLSNWPPPTAATLLHLTPAGCLTTSSPQMTGVRSYIYDPEDPTPSIGGALLSTTAGSVDNRDLEQRDDVIVFTSNVLTQSLEVMGQAELAVTIATSTPNVDLVARLCDVHPDERSMNVADGFIRLTGTDRDATGAVAARVRLSSVAHRFLPGHRLRLQVTSGAHPRISRNLGTEEPPVRGVRLMRAKIYICLDGEAVFTLPCA